MSNEFKREERYIVVKLKHLAGLQRAPLKNFLRENHVPSIDCVVVESDWPEYEPVWQMIERRMTGQPAVTAAEELQAVLHWRGKHAQAIKERDALQLLLNDRDEQLHTLEQSRRAEFDNGQAAESQLAALREELTEWKDTLKFNEKCWSEERGTMIDKNQDLQQRLADAERRNADCNAEIVAMVESALRRSFSLGQVYWQQADSDSTCQQNKSDQTMEIQAQHILNVVKSIKALAQPTEPGASE